MAVVHREKIANEESSDVVALPRTERKRPEFRLMFHPTHWFWGGKEHGWLPDLGRLVLEPGLQGIPDKAPGQPMNIAPARAHWENKGWMILDHMAPYLGKYKEYLAKWRGERGFVWTTTWETPEIVGGQVFWDWDKEGYYEFLKYLVDNRVKGIEPMDSRLKQKHLRNLQRQLDGRILPQLTSHPDSAALKARHDKLVTEIEAIKADMAKDTKKQKVQRAKVEASDE